MYSKTRRHFLCAGAGLVAASLLPACSNRNSSGASAHLVVVGGGYAGATTARYVRQWSKFNIRVTLVEPNANFVSCPFSNLVIGGLRRIGDITNSYKGLERVGVTRVRDRATAVDTNKRTVKLADGDTLNYDRLVITPGVDFMFDTIEGYDEKAQQHIMHAWKAGPQTVKLQAQIEAMKDGGVFAICIPRTPFRCPPAPYERASLVASYFKKYKPRSKVLVLDANETIKSKKKLFSQAWEELYSGVIEYHPESQLLEIDPSTLTITLEFDTVKTDVLNAIPPQRAGNIARNAGLKLVNDRWVDVNWLTMESTNTPNVHVLGDAAFPAPRMPKSGHMANQQGKVAAAAIINLLADQEPNPEPLVMNTCYSFLDANSVGHVSSVHSYDEKTKMFQPVEGAGGLSAKRNQQEVEMANAWAQNIWADTLGL